jgi:subtilisin family serine protease
MIIGCSGTLFLPSKSCSRFRQPSPRFMDMKTRSCIMVIFEGAFFHYLSCIRPNARLVQQLWSSSKVRSFIIYPASDLMHVWCSMSDGDSQFLVVFSTPTDNAALSAFAAFTRRPLLSAIGDRAYIAVANDDWASTARSFPGVLTVQKRLPAGKVSPQLKSVLKLAASPSHEIIAHCFPGQGCTSAARDLIETNLPCTRYTHHSIIEVHCGSTAASSAVDTLSQSPGVHFLHLKARVSTRNYAGRSIIGTGTSQTSTSIPSHVFDAIPLNPATSVIAVADSGLDRNNCFFCNSNLECKRDSATPAGRNVHKYWFMSSSDCDFCGRCGTAVKGSQPAQACGNDVDQIGHGTHVCGTIAGKSLMITSPSTERQNGIAAGASLFFQDIHNAQSKSACLAAGLLEGCGDGLSPPTDLFHLFKPAYDAGARVHSNSWGCAASTPETPYDCNVYEKDAMAIDNFVFRYEDFLVLVAASNDGLNADDRTVGAPATCKNCLSVGATQLNADQVAADAAYTYPSSFCDQVLESNRPRCCISVPPSCDVADCCAAGTSQGVCFTCCNRPCTVPGHSPSASNLAAFSSRGPTMDSRFKPDIVAPGEAISSACAGVKPESSTEAAQAAGLPNHCSVSPIPSVNCALVVESGTSMATPLMAGAIECDQN